MFQLFKNIEIEFLGYIFLELFAFESGKLFFDTLYTFLESLLNALSPKMQLDSP